MNDIATQERLAQGSRALRLARARRLITLFAVLVLLPTAVAAIYYGAVVTPQYESVAIMAVDSGVGSDEADAKKKGSSSERDLHVIRAHITSHAMLDILSKNHDLLSHYQSGDVDWGSRLASDAGSEKTYDYFKNHVLVKLDQDATLSMHVYAFSADKAHELAQAIVDEANLHLDRQSAATRDEVMDQPEAVADDARQRLLETGKRNPDDALEMEVARHRLAAALRAVERAEQDVANRQRSLWVVAPPSKPNEPSRPRRLWNIATVFVTSLALAGVALLLGDFVREHAKF